MGTQTQAQNQDQNLMQKQVSVVSIEDKKINHYEKLREDVRSEIKMRITQRDNFAIQLITTLGLLCTLGFANEGFSQVLVIAPLLSIYYTMQILYSYKLHDALAGYLRDILEPELSELCHIKLEHEWESYYSGINVPGIRRIFFLWSMWIVSSLSVIYLGITSYLQGNSDFFNVVLVAGSIYVVSMIYVTYQLYIKKVTKKGPQGNERSSRTAENQA
jgi:hypothetical protein